MDSEIEETPLLCLFAPRTVNYEAGKGASKARSLWRLEPLRIRWDQTRNTHIRILNNVRKRKSQERKYHQTLTLISLRNTRTSCLICVGCLHVEQKNWLFMYECHSNCTVGFVQTSPPSALNCHYQLVGRVIHKVRFCLPSLSIYFYLCVYHPPFPSSLSFL